MTNGVIVFAQVFAKYVNKWICIACPFQGTLFIIYRSDWGQCESKLKYILHFRKWGWGHSVLYVGKMLDSAAVDTNSDLHITGAPGYINDTLLTGLQFIYGFESLFFVSRWSMHQLVIFK
ncbi:hypothetical protein GIB67_014818 [Kingdonia uniflora]|uniref:Uncharacterized protein n=1 Tax=Kingdonia uniflora TaxID=39325 RepID=A0A7J7LBZ0_9MAGN|nr:hypothetical protein GIB67_014818 [Kingdonia uniflora]